MLVVNSPIKEPTFSEGLLSLPVLGKFYFQDFIAYSDLVRYCYCHYMDEEVMLSGCSQAQLIFQTGIVLKFCSLYSLLLRALESLTF